MIGKVGIDAAEDRVSQLMLFQQAPEAQNTSGIRCCPSAQVDANETMDHLAIVKGIFDPFIGEPEAVLCHVHAQYPL